MTAPAVKPMGVDWLACSVILRSRVRPEDPIENRDEGAVWLAENHVLSLSTVNAVLGFHDGAI